MNAKAWANAQLASGSNAQSHVTAMQLRCADASKSVAAACEDAVRNIPRWRNDLTLVARNIAETRDAISALATLGSASNTAFDSLLVLDMIRSRMEAARNALQEAENWNSLTSELDEIFANSDFTKAGSRLAEASRSLALLQGTPDYEEKRSLLFTLQNQLESAVVNDLVLALKVHDLDRVKRLRIVFEHIQRSNEFSACFYKTVKAPLLKKWLELNQDLAKANASNVGKQVVPFTNIWKQFLNETLNSYRSEVRWIEEIFPNVVQTFMKLIQQTFNSLKPSLRFSLDSLKTVHDEDLILIVASAFSATVEWCIHVECYLLPMLLSKKEAASVVKKPSAMQLTGVNAATTLPQASSVPAAATPTRADVLAWSSIILEPFVPYQETYSALETAHLLASVSSHFVSQRRKPNTNSSERVLSSALDAILETVLPQVLRTAEGAIHRGIEFTGGVTGASGSVRAVDAFLEATLTRLSGVLGLVTAIAGGRDEVPLGNVVLFEGSKATDVEDNEDDAIEFVGDVSGASGAMRGDGREWVAFEFGLRVLAVLKTVTESFEGLQDVILDLLCEANTERIASNNTVSDFLDHGKYQPEDHASSTSVFNCISAIKLTQASPLNDSELHNFYSDLDTLKDSSAPLATAQEPIPTSLTSTKLLSKTFKTLNNLVQRTQKCLFTLISAPVYSNTAGVSQQASWNNTQAAMPRFSSSPSVYITRVGEALLTLPQRFDMHVMSGSGGATSEIGFGIHAIPHLLASDFEGVAEDGFELEDIVHLWITAVARGAMRTVVDTVFGIEKLRGQVVEAMDVDVLQDVSEIVELCQGGEEELKAAVAQGRDGGVAVKVAKMRGISV
ncbi:oligomeric Golgi complex subunit 7 [Chytriomyces cf. hyalinus JEL632]|nr:oligomeric Golgi complex subunit 7 [Chytriomyces cf. hyalinus JEL632]